MEAGQEKSPETRTPSFLKETAETTEESFSQGTAGVNGGGRR